MLRAALLLSLTVLATVAEAQFEATLEEMYGGAVHDFFAGQDYAATRALDEVVAEGSQDPRVYYFRGLANLRLGRQDQAIADFEMGARLEARDVNALYPVDRSLMRIQGYRRVQLEKFRRQARLERARELRDQRHQQTDPFRDQRPGQPSRPRNVPPPADDATAPDLRGDPFASDPPATGPVAPAPPTSPAPAEPALPTEDNLFDDAPSDTPAEEDPLFSDDPPATTPAPAEESLFGDPQAAPPAAPGGETPPPTGSEDDPFGGDADDPFGGEDPFGGT